MTEEENKLVNETDVFMEEYLSYPNWRKWLQLPRAFLWIPKILKVNEIITKEIERLSNDQN